MVLELPTASFFWVSGGELRTPPLSELLLDSITRRLVIELAGARETATTPADLETADEAFVASSVREVMAVRRIEGRELPAARPVTETTAREVRAHIEAQLAGN